MLKVIVAIALCWVIAFSGSAFAAADSGGASSLFGGTLHRPPIESDQVSGDPRFVLGAVTYSNQAAFLAAVPKAVLEDFEDSILGATIFDAFTVSSTNTTNAYDVSNTVINGRAPTSGSRFIDGSFRPGGTVRFSFISPLSAFGVNLTDPLDFQLEDHRLDFETDSGIRGTVASAPIANAEVRFFGLTDFSSSFSEITFTLVNIAGVPGSDGIGFDDAYTLSASSPVPLPAVLPTFAVALGWLGARKRRSRAAT